MNPLPDFLMDAIHEKVQYLIAHGLTAPFYVLGNVPEWPDGLHVALEHGELIFMRDTYLTNEIFIYNQEGFDRRHEPRPFYTVIDGIIQ